MARAGRKAPRSCSSAEQGVHVAVQRPPERRAVGLEDGVAPALQRGAAHEREQPADVDRAVVGVERERVLAVGADAADAGDVAVAQGAAVAGRVDGVAQRAVGDRDPRAAGGGHRGELAGEHGVGRHGAHDLGGGRGHARPRVRERPEREHVRSCSPMRCLERGDVVARAGGRPAGGHGEERERVAAQRGQAQQDAVEREQVARLRVLGAGGGRAGGKRQRDADRPAAGAARRVERAHARPAARAGGERHAEHRARRRRRR